VRSEGTRESVNGWQVRRFKRRGVVESVESVGSLNPVHSARCQIVAQYTVLCSALTRVRHHFMLVDSNRNIAVRGN
jgi:hypothetical protein